MTTADPHPELVGNPREQRLRDILDLFHTEGFEAPPAPDYDCECEWGQYRQGNSGVAILDGHRECPFCRGRIGGENTDD